MGRMNTMNTMNSRTCLNSQQVNDSTNDSLIKSSNATISLVVVLLVVFIGCQIYQSLSISELAVMQKGQSLSISELAAMQKELAVMQKEQFSLFKDLAMMQKELSMTQKELSSSVNSIDIKLSGIIGGTVFVIAVFSGLTQIVGGLQALDDFCVKRQKRIEDENKKLKLKNIKNKKM
jgi:hypothetical protein